MLGHLHIGTEHFLLGLLDEDESVGGKALASAGITYSDAEEEVLKAVPRGTTAPAGHMPLTPRSQQVLELARQEACRLGHDQVTTGHLLMSLIHEGQGVAPQVMAALGADLEVICQQVEQALKRPLIGLSPP